MQRIIKTGRARFYLCWDEKPLERIIVNFNPIVSNFNLSGNFKLVHWQAIPKGLRQFGVYDSESDTYLSTRENISFENKDVELLQLDENVYKHVPTAVICLREYESLSNVYQ